MYNIIKVGSNQLSDTSQHPHYDMFSVCDGFDKLFSLFMKENVNKQTKDRIAINIGILHSNRDI